MNSEQIQVLLRDAIRNGGMAWATAHGISGDNWNAVAGAVVTLLMTAWAFYSRRNTALVVSGEKAKVALESPKP